MNQEQVQRIMATLILIIALIVEVVFAAYCIATRSDQMRVRSYLRVGAFAVFLVLTVLSVFRWGFRWYLLAALLLVWAAFGGWTLIRRKAAKPGYPAWRTVARGAGGLLLVFFALVPALVLPQVTLPRPTGTHPVATAEYSYTDPNRVETYSKTGGNRKVGVACWYPQDPGGPYPLVMFDHGALGTKASNTSTYLDLASNGYVVCALDHPYHSFYTRGADGRLVTIDPTYLQEFLGLNSGKYDEATRFKLQQEWLDLRAADVNFVLDTILAGAKDPGADPVYLRVDPQQKIGLLGHSMGGATGALVARERQDIGAVVSLDADMLGEYLSYTDGRYALNDQTYPVPILNIFADDMVRLMAAVQDANDVIAVKHVAATAPSAYEVHLTGTDHMSLTDLPLISPFLVSIINSAVPKAGGVEADPYGTIQKMNGLVLSFFNAYLKGQGTFTPPAE
jgi:predicted dienelactone hydrolase